MDKSTLSNYGWIVIAVLVLAVMIALATPFGSYIKTGVENTTQGLFDTSEKAMNVVGMSAGDGSFDSDASGSSTPDPALNPSGIIPEGATYIVKSTGETLSTGATMPDSVANGDIYTYGDYEYRYNQYASNITSAPSRKVTWTTDETQNGWGVIVLLNNKTEYGEILQSVNFQPTTNMVRTFNFCSELTTAPTIPSSVVDMTHTFSYCSNLTTAPTIPSSVVDMTNTFSYCSNLTTAPTIPSSVENMTKTFNCCSNLTIAPDLSNAQNLENMSGTFYGCSKLTTAPTIPSSVVDMTETFSYCSNLTTAPDLSNAQNLKNMTGTFSYCPNLTTAPTIPSSVVDMTETFYGCSKLTTAPTIPSSVTDMRYTFMSCKSLTAAPTIPSGVTNMYCTFFGCTNLTGTIEVNANPTSYSDCLKFTRITDITGSCSQETKDALMATK